MNQVKLVISLTRSVEATAPARPAMTYAVAPNKTNLRGMFPRKAEKSPAKVRRILMATAMIGTMVSIAATLLSAGIQDGNGVPAGMTPHEPNKARIQKAKTPR